MRLPVFNIALKLPLALVGSALVVGLCIGLTAYEIGIRTVEAQSAASIDTAVNSSIDHLNDFFGNTEVDLQILAQRLDTAVSIHSMSAAIDALAANGDPTEILQNAYIAQNPNSEIERDQLDQSAGLAGAYDALHAAVHPAMRALLLQRGYTDLLMLDGAGRVVYTTEKASDFGTIPAGDGDGLALVFKTALAAPAGTVVFQDFTKYGPADNQAMSFMAIPVFDGDAPVGVVAFELSDGLLATKIASVRGIGQTGEAIIVGPDKLMRTQSRYSIASDVLATSMDSDVVNAALAGTPASGTLDNFRGTQATISAVPFEVLGTHWAMVAAQDTDEVFAPVGEMGRTIMLLGSALLIIAILVGLWIARSISRPVTAMTQAMTEMAGGDLEVEVVGASRRDELGRMARAVEVFRQHGLRVRELTLEETALVERNRKARADMMAELRDSFGEVVGAANQGDFSGRVQADFADNELNVLAVNVNEMIETVDRGLAESGAVLAAIAKTDLTRRVTGHYEGAFKRLKMDTNDVAERLSDVVINLKLASKGLKTATSEIAGGAGDLSARTAKQSATLQQASEVMMELAGTVLKNAERAHDASTNAGHVTQTAEQGGAVMRQATEAMDLITASSNKISRIMGLIDDIAFQTNLLALNASVEAARAGEAGKGFAVVAVEVRRLAQSAAGASKDIKVLIDQSAGQVGKGTQLVGQAAARLEEMLAAARANSDLLDGIARESREQALAIDEVNHSVRNLDEMTQHNASLVEQMNSAIVQTDTQASELDRIVDLFTTGSGHWRSKMGDGAAALDFPAAAKRA